MDGSAFGHRRIERECANGEPFRRKCALRSEGRGALLDGELLRTHSIPRGNGTWILDPAASVTVECVGGTAVWRRERVGGRIGVWERKGRMWARGWGEDR